MSVTTTAAKSTTVADEEPRVVALPQIVTYDLRAKRLERISGDDGRRFELIDGEEFVSPSPTTAHQRASRRLFLLVHNFVDARNLGEVFTAPWDVKLAEFVTVIPDLCFVSTERAHLIGERALLGAPDLVVEVLSPSTQRDDLNRKMGQYARYGVPEYWVLDVLNRRFVAYTNANGSFTPIPVRDHRIESIVLPGLVIDLTAFFASLDRSRPKRPRRPRSSSRESRS